MQYIKFAQTKVDLPVIDAILFENCTIHFYRGHSYPNFEDKLA